MAERTQKSEQPFSVDSLPIASFPNRTEAARVKNIFISQPLEATNVLGL